MAGAGVIDVDAALAQLLAGVVQLSTERVPIGAANGRILAEPVDAALAKPPFAASAMDGYAVRWSDVPGPWRVVGEAAAGRCCDVVVGVGTAVRIFTGAPMPAGTDTVVVQEDMTRDGVIATLVGDGPLHQGAHVRAAGQDFTLGDRIVDAGNRLTPARLGLLAAAGHGTVPVVRRPRITIIATGNELVPPGTVPGPDQIVSANPVMISALFAAAGALVSDPGIVGDDCAALAAVFREADADVIVTIGGASVGDHDLVVPVLRSLGAEIDFWRVAMRPGKPMFAGTLGRTRILGLPGNPVSAFVAALLFGVPLVARLGGRGHRLPMEALPLAGPLPANADRRDHLRARRTPAGVLAFESQDSARLGNLASADLLIVRNPGARAAAIGETVECIALDMFQPVS